MSQYEEWVKNNIYAPLEGAFNSGVCELKHDFKIQQKLAGNPIVPWFYNCPDTDRDCDVWFSLMFKVYNFVPMGCIKCWKIALRIPDLKTLFAIRDMQEVSGLDCKCGMETREFVPADYTAFWYAPHGCSVEDARELQKRVRSDVQKIDDRLEPILKRGCTEMEMMTRNAYGVGSDRWEELHTNYKWGEKEKKIKATFTENVELFKMEHCEDQRTWLSEKLCRHAFAHGDMTYLEYTDGLPLYPEPVTYHE